jgi:low affinity Fe/Cu permease
MGARIHHRSSTETTSETHSPAKPRSGTPRPRRVGKRSRAGRREPRPAERPKGANEVFRHVALGASSKFGSPAAFLAATALILGWAIAGPFFGFSQTWQLFINSVTTVVTFLMVFLIQATQNRDARAIHLKLDELIRSSAARNVFADLEDASEAELAAFQREFDALRRQGMHASDAAQTAQERTRGERKKRSEERPR